MLEVMHHVLDLIQGSIRNKFVSICKILLQSSFPISRQQQAYSALDFACNISLYYIELK